MVMEDYDSDVSGASASRRHSTLISFLLFFFFYLLCLINLVFVFFLFFSFFPFFYISFYSFCFLFLVYFFKCFLLNMARHILLLCRVLGPWRFGCMRTCALDARRDGTTICLHIGGPAHIQCSSSVTPHY